MGILIVGGLFVVVLVVLGMVAYQMSIENKKQ